MKKVTKKALSLAVTTMLLMNTFTTIAFADPGHDHGNGYAHGIECDKEQFANGHDNRDHSKQNGEQEPEEQQEEILIEVLDEQIEEQQEDNEPAELNEEEGQQEEEIQQEEAEEEETAEEESEEAAEEVQQEDEIQQEEIAEEAEAVEEEAEEEASEQIEEIEEAEEVEEIEEETVEEVEEEARWESYTLYNYISINEGKSYISLNTQENGISAAKPAAEFHRENGNKRYNLSASEYEIEDYDLAGLVITSNGIRFVEQSVAKEGQAYFTARLDRVEAVAAANFRASSCVEGIESFTSIGSGTITFHRNWYLTLNTPMEANQKLLTGVQMPNGKYIGIDYTDTFKAVDSRMIPFSTKLNKDQYEIEDYDFSGLTLEYNNEKYAYRPDGPVAGDGNGFHYYTVKFQKLDKLNKSTYGGGYLAEGWPAWPLVDAKAADPDGFPYAAGYYHRDYTVTLSVGDAPAVEEVAESVEAPVVEEITQTEEPQVEEVAEPVEAPATEEQPAPVEEIVEEIINIVPVIAEIAQIEEVVEPVEAAVEEEPAAVEEVAQIEEEPAAEIVEETEEVEETIEEIPEIVEETVEEIAQIEDETTTEEVAELVEAPVEETVEESAAAEEAIFAVEEVKAQARTRKHTAANVSEPAVNEATTNQTETIETIEEETEVSIEDNTMPMAAVEIAAVEAEEILEEEMPLAAAPFEAVSAAQAEEVASVETDAPSFIEVASMQVADFVEMEEAAIPMTAAGTWSLATMIFGAMSLLLAIFTIASKSIGRGLKAAAAVALAATGAILLITSDFSGMMVTADKGTLAVVILNIFEAVFASTASNEARLG